MLEKNLEKEITAYIASRLAEDIELKDIQTEVNEKFSQKLTYMDIRILASSVEYDWNAGEEQSAEKQQDEKPAADVPAEPAPEPEESSGTVVEVNKLVQPGTLASGTVKFANGATATWYVDQMGRLGLDNLNGAQPGEADMRDFMTELRKVLR
ncbi:MAG: hypothetical protein MJ025_05025 [Victivallaceae bacterium]|nr:hypothetical protein [Victivallaceae bacterium]